MKNENLEDLFQGLDFDISEPEHGHKKRFEAKLARESERSGFQGIFSLISPIFGIAASFLLAIILVHEIWAEPGAQKQDLASVSSEMKNTQQFYSSAIKTELYRLQEERSPATEAIIKDALIQMEILENDYEKLKFDLAESGQDNRVIFAMITNFQKRIDLLNQVLEKVNKINQLKNNENESKFL